MPKPGPTTEQRIATLEAEVRDLKRNAPADIGPVYETNQGGRIDHTGFYDYARRLRWRLLTHA
jgi:hypothetical protein